MRMMAEKCQGAEVELVLDLRVPQNGCCTKPLLRWGTVRRRDRGNQDRRPPALPAQDGSTRSPAGDQSPPAIRG